ncbi:hypothetical protein LJC07_02625 [Christensenellaceae bacterium OttesenSCG-928-L17]|nr:hypothetical protein [Christensenellaceae bacterium OttesenSCG-928-L17]
MSEVVFTVDFLEFRKRVEAINEQTKKLFRATESEALRRRYGEAAHDAQATILREYVARFSSVDFESAKKKLATNYNVLGEELLALEKKLASFERTMGDVLEMEESLEIMKRGDTDAALLESFEAILNELRNQSQKKTRDLEELRSCVSQKRAEVKKAREELSALEFPKFCYLSDDELHGIVAEGRQMPAEDGQNLERAPRGDVSYTPDATERIINMLLENSRRAYGYGLSGVELDAVYAVPSIQDVNSRAVQVLRRMMDGQIAKAAMYLTENAPGMVIQRGRRGMLCHGKERVWSGYAFRAVRREDVGTDKIPERPLPDGDIVYEDWSQAVVFDPIRQAAANEMSPVAAEITFPFLGDIDRLRAIKRQGEDVSSRTSSQVKCGADRVVQALVEAGLDFTAEDWAVSAVSEKFYADVELLRSVLIAAKERSIIGGEILATISTDALLQYSYKKNTWVRIFLAQKYDLYSREEWLDVGKIVNRSLREVA